MLMQQLAKLLPLLALASAAPTTFSPRADDGKSQVKVGDVLPTAIKADVQAMLDYFNIPGAVVAVVSPDEAVNGVEVFGVKDAEGNKMTADTFYSVASNTKFVTALSLATMEASGNYTLPNGDKFTCDAKWKDIYPDFKMVDQNATEQATLANFMMMNTGIPTVNWAIGANDTAISTLERFSGLLPNAPFPTNTSQYSTIHYGAVGGVPEFVAKQTLSDFLNTYIWGPAGMEAKFNALDAKATDRRGQAFNIELADTTACYTELSNGTAYNETESCGGKASIFDFWSDGTTLEQAGGGNYKWAKLAIGKTDIVPKAALNILYGDRYGIPIQGSETIEYGLGVQKIVNAESNQTLYSHGGAVYGHNSAFYRDYERQTAVFVVIPEDRFGFLLSDVMASYTVQSLTNTTTEGQLQRLIDLVVTRTTGVPVGEAAAEAEEAESADGSQGAEGADSSTGPVEGGDAAAGAGAGLAMPPANPRPLPDNLVIEGRYTAPGYPEITFAPLNLSDPAAVDEVGIAAELLETVSLIGIDVTRPSYLGAWESSFTDYVLITPFDGVAHNFTLILTRPKIGELNVNGTVADWEPAPLDRTNNKIYGFGPAVFGLGKEGQAGLGFFGGVYGQPGTVITSPVYAEDEVESTAGVFYTKQ